MLPPISDDDALGLETYLTFAISQMGDRIARHCVNLLISCIKSVERSKRIVGVRIRQTGELAARGRMMIFRFRLILWLGNMDMDQKERSANTASIYFISSFQINTGSALFVRIQTALLQIIASIGELADGF